MTIREALLGAAFAAFEVLEDRLERDVLLFLLGLGLGGGRGRLGLRFGLRLRLHHVQSGRLRGHRLRLDGGLEHLGLTLVGVVPGTAMADAFSQAGYYDNAYGEQAEGGEGAGGEGAGPEGGEQAQAATEAREQGQERLEDIVEDLKRKNATE